jgi:hypothetical protein
LLEWLMRPKFRDVCFLSSFFKSLKRNAICWRIIKKVNLVFQKSKNNSRLPSWLICFVIRVQFKRDIWRRRFIQIMLPDSLNDAGMILWEFVFVYKICKVREIFNKSKISIYIYNNKCGYKSQGVCLVWGVELVICGTIE